MHGSVRVSAAGAEGRLEVDLLAKNSALASARVRVGKLVRPSLIAGTVPFSVPLSQKARNALKRNGRLAVTVRLVLKTTSGALVTVTRGVVMRP